RTDTLTISLPLLLRSHRSTLFPYTTLFRSMVLAVANTSISAIHCRTSSKGCAPPSTPTWYPWPTAGMTPWASRYVTLATTPSSRSEEHTSELQSRGHLVCRLLLEKKNIYE